MLDAVSALTPAATFVFVMLAKRAAPSNAGSATGVGVCRRHGLKRTDTWVLAPDVGCHTLPRCKRNSRGSIRFPKCLTRHYFMSNLKSPLKSFSFSSRLAYGAATPSHRACALLHRWAVLGCRGERRALRHTGPLPAA
jgi:hypothetical protein